MPPGQLCHEGNSRLFDPLPQQASILGGEGERDRRIERLAVVAGGENWRGALPLVGEVENRVDVVPRRQRAEAVHGNGAESNDLFAPVCLV
jgi:hypothetical protein